MAILAVTGDTHGEVSRFQPMDEPANKHLHKGDYLFVCGDFGYLFHDDFREHKYLKFLAEEIPYTICFCDGNHENFDVLNTFEVSEWNGGKVHVIGSDREGNPKVIHRMRGQVFLIEGKRVFAFGGACSHDIPMRTKGRSWWPQEMPTEEEMAEAIRNLEAVNYKVDYIITHAAPETTMSVFHPAHIDEKPLNDFLENIREKTSYAHWYMGHLHINKDIGNDQTILWSSVRNMEDNSELT